MSRGMSDERAFAYTEAIKKEYNTKLRWFVKNYEKLAEENRKSKKKVTDEVNKLNIFQYSFPISVIIEK